MTPSPAWHTPVHTRRRRKRHPSAANSSNNAIRKNLFPNSNNLNDHRNSSNNGHDDDCNVWRLGVSHREALQKALKLRFFWADLLLTVLCKKLDWAYIVRMVLQAGAVFIAGFLYGDGGGCLFGHVASAIFLGVLACSPAVEYVWRWRQAKMAFSQAMQAILNNPQGSECGREERLSFPGEGGGFSVLTARLTQETDSPTKRCATAGDGGGVWMGSVPSCFLVQGDVVWCGAKGMPSPAARLLKLTANSNKQADKEPDKQAEEEFDKQADKEPVLEGRFVEEPGWYRILTPHPIAHDSPNSHPSQSRHHAWCEGDVWLPLVFLIFNPFLTLTLDAAIFGRLLWERRWVLRDISGHPFASRNDDCDGHKDDDRHPNQQLEQDGGCFSGGMSVVGIDRGIVRKLAQATLVTWSEREGIVTDHVPRPNRLFLFRSAPAVNKDIFGARGEPTARPPLENPFGNLQQASARIDDDLAYGGGETGEWIAWDTLSDGTILPLENSSSGHSSSSSSDSSDSSSEHAQDGAKEEDVRVLARPLAVALSLCSQPRRASSLDLLKKHAMPEQTICWRPFLHGLVLPEEQDDGPLGQQSTAAAELSCSEVDDVIVHWLPDESLRPVLGTGKAAETRGCCKHGFSLQTLNRNNNDVSKDTRQKTFYVWDAFSRRIISSQDILPNNRLTSRLTNRLANWLASRSFLQHPAGSDTLIGVFHHLFLNEDKGCALKVLLGAVSVTCHPKPGIQDAMEILLEECGVRPVWLSPLTESLTRSLGNRLGLPSDWPSSCLTFIATTTSKTGSSRLELGEREDPVTKKERERDSKSFDSNAFDGPRAMAKHLAEDIDDVPLRVSLMAQVRHRPGILRGLLEDVWHPNGQTVIGMQPGENAWWWEDSGLPWDILVVVSTTSKKDGNDGLLGKAAWRYVSMPAHLMNSPEKEHEHATDGLAVWTVMRAIGCARLLYTQHLLCQSSMACAFLLKILLFPWPSLPVGEFSVVLTTFSRLLSPLSSLPLSLLSSPLLPLLLSLFTSCYAVNKQSVDSVVCEEAVRQMPLDVRLFWKWQSVKIALNLAICWVCKKGVQFFCGDDDPVGMASSALILNALANHYYYYSDVKEDAWVLLVLWGMFAANALFHYKSSNMMAIIGHAVPFVLITKYYVNQWEQTQREASAKRAKLQFGTRLGMYSPI